MILLNILFYLKAFQVKNNSQQIKTGGQGGGPLDDISRGLGLERVNEKDESADQGRERPELTQQTAEEEVTHQGVKEVDDKVSEMIEEWVESGIPEGNRQAQVSTESGRPKVKDSFRVELADNRVIAD